MNRVIRSIALLLGSKISIWKTIFFNFHYLPFSAAVKFPVILYRGVKLAETKGRIILANLPAKPATVRIGRKTYGFQTRNDRTIWEQQGGTVILGNNVRLGKGTFIHVGKSAELKIEGNTTFGGNDRIICEKSVTIKQFTKVAWDVQIIDTDFRATINTVTKTRNCVEKPIVIGRHNWLCFGCTVLKGSITPDNCIVSAKSLINKDFSDAGHNIVIGMDNNVKVLSKYITWDTTGGIEDACISPTIS
jgi:acetyltransferase-like isoleucine patch superfamily enzyme